MSHTDVAVNVLALQERGFTMVRSTAMYRFTLLMGAIVIFALAATGCAGRPSVFPNKDKSLRKTSTEFAADAAKRHPYPADAERGGEANARVQVGYSLNKLDVVNFSDEPWVDVDLWREQLALARARRQAIWYGIFAETFNPLLGQALNGEITAEEALQAAADEWNTLKEQVQG